MSRRNDVPAGRADEVDHGAAQRLLPWLLTGTLDEAELAQVRQHLRSCAACRDELAWERRLRAAGRDAAGLGAGLDPDAALGRLAPRLAAGPARAARLRRWARALAANEGCWLRPLAAAQFAVIAALGALLLARPDLDGRGDAAYHALGAETPVAGDLVVSFRPDTPERELRRILRGSGTRLLDGPSAAGAYVLAARGAAPAHALARLRAEPAVTLAQPLGPERRP